MFKVLVVGGAGYIGSHMVKVLAKNGCVVTTLDNLSTGFEDAVLYGQFIEGDLGDHALLDRVFNSENFDAVIHFASSIQVAESMRLPLDYYSNNVSNTLNLLRTMIQYRCSNFIFSSSAAIFGNPQTLTIDELHPKQPVNPYGRSKWMVEEMLADFDKAYGLKSVCLRYFNAAGADPEGMLGERHSPETHLIPLILQVASGRLDAIKVFGRNYGTPDGTCIRDYVHVQDLCQAHWLALQWLTKGGPSTAFNLGSGEGFSVQEIINMAQEITGKSIRTIESGRRMGDPERLVANPQRAKQELQWQVANTDIQTIIRHAWRWEQLRI